MTGSPTRRIAPLLIPSETFISDTNSPGFICSYTQTSVPCIWISIKLFSRDIGRTVIGSYRPSSLQDTNDMLDNPYFTRIVAHTFNTC